jgi:histidine triad (HIT) family protein
VTETGRYQVLHKAEDGEAVTEPESYEQANSRAATMALRGVTVFSVMTEEGASAYFDRAAEMATCPFCAVIAGRAPVSWVVAPGTWRETVAFVPLDPLTEGHVLFAPKEHVRDFSEQPQISQWVMRRAAELMRWTNRPMTLLSMSGEEAGQQVPHFHLHLIPRTSGDGLVRVGGKR